MTIKTTVMPLPYKKPSTDLQRMMEMITGNPTISTSAGTLTNMTTSTIGSSNYGPLNSLGGGKSSMPTWMQAIYDQAKDAGFETVDRPKTVPDEIMKTALAQALAEKDGGTAEDHAENAAALESFYREETPVSVEEIVYIDEASAVPTSFWSTTGASSFPVVTKQQIQQHMQAYQNMPSQYAQIFGQTVHQNHIAEHMRLAEKALYDAANMGSYRGLQMHQAWPAEDPSPMKPEPDQHPNKTLIERLQGKWGGKSWGKK